jgi:hypothetical protein
LAAFLNPKIRSFKLVKTENEKIIQKENRRLVLEFKQFEKDNALLKEENKKLKKWPANKQKVLPHPPFCVSREDNIVKVSQDHYRIYELLLTYGGRFLGPCGDELGREVCHIRWE